MQLNEIKQKLFELENIPELLDFNFEFDDILMLPFVRYQLFQGVINNELCLQEAHSSSETITVKEKVISFVCPFLLNPFFRKKEYPILMLNWTSNTTGIKKGNKYFNKRDDYFGSLFPQKTLFLEQSIKGKFRYPRVHRNVLNRDSIDIIGKIAKKIKEPSAADKITINRFIEFLKSNFAFKIDKNILVQVENILLSNSVQLELKKYLYSKILKKIDLSWSLFKTRLMDLQVI